MSGLEATSSGGLSFAERVALARPEDTARGMFFIGALDAVRTLGGEATADACRAATGQQRFIPFLSYPMSAFLRMTEAAVRMLEEELGGGDEVLRKLGARSASDFFSSSVGRMVLTLAEENPRRFMISVPSAYRAAVNYGTRSVEWTGASRCNLFMQRDLMPPVYHEGVLHAALLAVGVRNPQVLGHSTGALDAKYDISWDE